MDLLQRTRTPRAHDVPAHPASVALRRSVARWALANGHPVSRDALAVVVAVRTDHLSGQVEHLWTVQHVDAVLDRRAGSWCRLHGVPCPDELATTLATYLRYLSAHRLLEAGSHSPNELRRAVAQHTPSLQRSRRRHPAGSSAAIAPVLPIG